MIFNVGMVLSAYMINTNTKDYGIYIKNHLSNYTSATCGRP